MSKKLNIAINGFGRIGRALTKINEEFHKFNLVLINDLNPNIENLAYLLKYDSTYGNLNSKIKISKKKIFINNKSLNQIKLAQKNALIETLRKNRISFREFKLKKDNVETLGQLFSYFILETILIGKLTNINPFNQPAVEQVKVVTKKYLLK